MHVSVYYMQQYYQSRSYSIETLSVSRTVSEILSIIEWRDLETGG